MGQKKTNGVLLLYELIKLQQKIVPEIMSEMIKRYNILRAIYDNEPVGRRLIANVLQLGERVIRTDVDFLKRANLIDVNVSGMTVTEEGKEIIHKLKEIVHELQGLSEVEDQLRKALGIRNAIIVCGDMEEDGSLINEIGRTSANYLKSVVKSGNVVAVTGGSTVKACIDNVPKINNLKDILVLPARGGMGKDVARQANTLAATLAGQLNGKHKLLHVPDNFSDEKILKEIRNERSIKEVLEKLKSCDVLIFGIGRADEMGRRRGLCEESLNSILEKGAVGEAFGHYFNKNGDVIFSTPTIGFNTEDIWKINTLIAVAGKKSKAEAIISTLINKKNSVLITDEGTAKEILNILSE